MWASHLGERSLSLSAWLLSVGKGLLSSLASTQPSLGFHGNRCQQSNLALRFSQGAGARGLWRRAWQPIS